MYHFSFFQSIQVKKLSIYIVKVHYCPDKYMSLLRSLTDMGQAVPPVSPEVIKILLFQRSRQLLDAPAEHVKPRELCDGKMFQ